MAERAENRNNPHGYWTFGPVKPRATAVLALSLALALCALSLLSAPTAAAAAAGRKQKASIPLLKKEISLKGIFSEHASWVRVPELWEVRGRVDMDITFRYSGVLDVEMSSLTIYVNDRPGQSVRLIDFEGKADDWVVAKLRIAANVLKPGWNKVAFKAYLRTRKHDCDDKDNPGLWMAVSERSKMTLSWEATRVQADLARFPQSYVDRMDLDPKPPNTRIVVPAKSPGEVLDLAATVAAVLGQNGDLDPESLAGLLVAQQGQSIPSEHVILMGMQLNVIPLLQDWGLKKAWTAALKKAGVSLEQPAIVELVHPKLPWRRVLVVTAPTPKKAAAAARFLGSIEAREALGGTAIAIPEHAQVEILPPPSKVTRSFADMRVGSLYARGYSGLQEMDFDLRYPAHWLLGEETKLVLYIRYSQILAPESMLEIDLAGHPIASIPFVAEDPARSPGGRLRSRPVASTEPLRVEVPVPSWLLDGSGHLYLTFRFMIEVGTEDCALGTVENAWVAVEDRSFLQLDERGMRRDSLASYPALLLEQAHMSGMAVVLAERDAKSFDLALSAMVALGAEGRADRLLAPTLRDEAEWIARADRSADVLYIGTWADSAWLQGISGALPASFDAEGEFVSEHKTFGHGAEYYQSAGIVGVAPNPDDPEARVVFYATAFEAAGLQKAGQLLMGRLASSRLKGNLVVIKTGKLFFLERLGIVEPTFDDRPRAGEGSDASASQNDSAAGGAPVISTAAPRGAPRDRPAKTPNYFLYFLIVVGGVVLLILLLFILSGGRKRGR